MEASSNSSLDMRLLIELFSGCYRENDVFLKEYCDAYTEVSKLLSFFGRLFYFVNRDVEQKLCILYEYYSSTPVEYKTIKTMIKYEYEIGVTGVTKNRQNIGCRTLLRLHRALLFVIELMTSICSATADASLRNLTKDAYDKYLAEYHPWAVRKAVHLAVYALPSLEHLVDHIVESQPEDSPFRGREKCKAGMLNGALPAMRKVYDFVQNQLAQRNMLELP
ncbi:Glycolipid transfer protein domain-containing protein 1 [Fasciola gigantica]|uniref:Glycolipid transfer protein domain-containing protein 1 n=1 Tax=Fasciola gigantica TaxID=46835 RepID=A0A504WW94_FASGI|nr:Glycolipid transfer protein domain-containing protein 1 [Fasciola gigantica]